ncbi:hypothetical protein DFH28DRAFT_1034036, partial [Melampsora americana]
MRLQLTLIALAFRFSSTLVLSSPANGIESSTQTHLSRSVYKRMAEPLAEISHIKEDTSLEPLKSIFSADGVISYKGSFKRPPRVFTYKNGATVPEEEIIGAETEGRQLKDELDNQPKSASEVSPSDTNIESQKALEGYSTKWLEKGLAPHVMILFGEALKINNKEVYPLTGTSFDVLKALPSDLNLNEQQGKLLTEDALRWYQTNKLASLDPEQQKILDFNVAMASLNHRPWWTEKNMYAWQTTNMPWETITQVGSILERKVTNTMSPEELNKVRKEILTVLDHFATHNNIEEDIKHSMLRSRGAIAQALRLVTGENKASKLQTAYPNFDEKLKLIGPQPNELKEIRTFLKNQAGQELHLDKNIRLVVHMQLLLNGIPYDIAERYAKAYKLVSSNILGAFSGEGRLNSAMKDILPGVDGGNIAHLTTYEALKSFFQDIYGPLNVRYVSLRAKSLLGVSERIRGFHVKWAPGV